MHTAVEYMCAEVKFHKLSRRTVDGVELGCTCRVSKCLPKSVDLTSKQSKLMQAKAKLRVGRYVFKMNIMSSLSIVRFTTNERIVFASAR